jgi:DOPA 4,5-dioxygenase
VSQVTDIREFHAHVYFDIATRPIAERVYDALGRHFGVKLGALHDRPVGLHAKPMFEATVSRELFAAVVPWLMVNRDGLSVLVHPMTDDPVADHETSPLWMGEPLALDIEFLRRHVRPRSHSGEARAAGVDD